MQLYVIEYIVIMINKNDASHYCESDLRYKTRTRTVYTDVYTRECNPMDIVIVRATIITGLLVNPLCIEYYMYINIDSPRSPLANSFSFQDTLFFPHHK